MYVDGTTVYALIRDALYLTQDGGGQKFQRHDTSQLVTIDVNPASPKYGKVAHTVTVGGRGEPHHMGLSDDRRYLWAGNLDDSKIFIFDIAADPDKPRLVKTIADLPEQSGFVGPHTFYALPGRVLVGNLSNANDHGGVTGLALYNNKGKKTEVEYLEDGKVRPEEK